MKTRFIKEIGTRVSLRIYWGDNCPKKSGFHNVERFVEDKIGHFSSYKKDGHAGGEVGDYPTEMWPAKCDCGAEVPSDAIRQVFNKTLYNTDSGSPEPGDLFYIDYLPENFYFDNHQGPFLCAILPNGREWIIDSRASNCGLPEDRVHRCWVKHGSPEDGTIHVDKNGHTCSAGAGSIWVDDYHGFLHNGQFT